MTLELCAIDHPTGTSNAQEDNRWWNQSTSDQRNMATAYPNPADNHANDGVDSTARKPKPKPRIRSNAAQNDKMVISPNDGVDPVGRNSNARPRGHAMDRDNRLLDQAEADGVARRPEQNPPTTCTPKVKQHYVYRQHQHLHPGTIDRQHPASHTAENAKQMVEEAARVTMQELKGLQGWDGTHWRKVAQLVWAQLGMVRMVVQHLPLAFEIPLHLIAIDMHMVDLAIIVVTQTWPPFNQMMMAREANVKDHPWYRLRHQPKSHPYYKVLEELTGPSSRAKHQAQPVDKGKGKEVGMDEVQGTRLPDIMAKTTGVAMQKPGNEEDQNREKAWGRSQSRCGRPAAKPVDASDQTSRGWSRSRRPTKKAKPVNEDVQDRRDINNPPKSWEVVPEAERANDLCHCDEYQEEVTILKQENADMRQEIEVTRTELAALHQVVDAIRNHLFPAPDMLNHPLVPFHATSNPTPVPHMPVMVELGTATSVVEVQSSQSSSRQESTEPPLASFEGGAGLEVPPSNVEPVHGPAGGLAISITLPPPAVGSAPGQEGRMEVD
ncbi:hypothetical protein BKA82DRAFT_19913 [Pisolithus tinctorius]|nr:hypothetical protein BKA82DRAFT_19913 [Pisolithus tinctorius]